VRTVKPLLAMGFSTLICACTHLHPLQDNVTDLPLADIVRRITCEARDTLHNLLDRNNRDEKEYQAFKAADKDLKDTKKKLLKPLENEVKELDKKRAQLRLVDRAIAEERDLIARFLYSILGMTAAEQAKQVANYWKLKKRLRELAADRIKLDYDMAAYFRAIRKHGDDLNLAEKAVNTKTRAMRRFKEWNRYISHSMAYGFRFKATETGAATASASYRMPIHLGLLSIGIGGSDTAKRDGERKLSLVISFMDLYETPCADPSVAVAETGVRATHYPVRGNIGVHEVLEQYFKILDRAKADQDAVNGGRTEEDDDESNGNGGGKARKIFAKTDSYVDTLTFTTTLTGSINPSVTLNPTPKDQFAASLGWSGTREDQHTVTISLSSADGDDDEDKEKDKITRVQIVDDDLFPIK
jgi:hypothetical protein